MVNKSTKFNDIEYSYNQPYGVEKKQSGIKMKPVSENALKKIGTKFTENK